VIFVINKWDLAKAEQMDMERWSEYLGHQFASLRFAPMAFLTAKTGKNVHKLVNLAQSIFKQARTRVSTGELNRVVRAAVLRNRPPVRRNQTPKVYFATQVATEPPTIVLKCNNPVLFDNSWRRYLLGVMREELPFHEVPIRLYLRQREQAEERRSSGERAVEPDEVQRDSEMEEVDWGDEV
jgi:GTP-binding protein